VETFQLRA